MIESKGYAALKAKEPLKPFHFKRRNLRENDVYIEIKFCGVCHSDIHTARGEWEGGTFPVVPGHEIVGQVKEVGSCVTHYKEGDWVGVGCMVDSCLECDSCKAHLEQYCEKETVPTYGGKDLISGDLTYGGYSNNIVVREGFVVKIPKNLDPAGAAPLLCAGITTYSPLKHWGVKKGDSVAVVGLGGLGHMGVQIAKAMGAQVTVFTTSPGKKEDAHKLGADHVVLSNEEKEMGRVKNFFDFILNTVAAPIDLSPYLECLKRDGTMTLVGLPDKPHPSFSPAELIWSRKNLSGSLIGGIKETQEMLNFCGKHSIISMIERIKIEQINEAFERTVNGDVKFRFVIEM